MEKNQKKIYNELNRLRELSLKYSKLILEEAEIIKENNPYYSLRLYEMQFKIYNELKLCFNINSENF